MFKRILVPLDGSALSERALPPALKIGELEGSRVMLLRAPVAEVSTVPEVAGFGQYHLRNLSEVVEAARFEAKKYVTQIAQASARAGVEFEPLVVEGEPAESILNTAREKQADLIVISTHGYSGLTRWVMGSVTERVIAHAPCPVLVIRAEQPISRLLIPLDGSELAEQAILPGLEIASAFGAEVEFFRAILPVPMENIHELEKAERGLGLQLQESWLAAAADYLKRQVENAQRRGLKAKAVVRTGPAASTLLDYAEAMEIDAVAMATHGRSGLQKWLYGSVTEKVLRAGHAHAMLIVRP
jgi:nucleotide-binding universal stress UspA family protein